MRKIWWPVKPMHISDLDSKLFIAEFDDARDKERVHRDGPWTFEKHLVLVSEVDGFKQIHEIKLEEALLWVRIHNLPLVARNEYMGNVIGNSLGRVEEVDLEK